MKRFVIHTPVSDEKPHEALCGEKIRATSDRRHGDVLVQCQNCYRKMVRFYA